MNQDEYTAAQALLDVLKVIYKIKPTTEDGIDVLVQIESSVEDMLKERMQRLGGVQ